MPVIPVYDTGPDAGDADGGERGDVRRASAVLIGTSRQGALYHLIKGHFQQRLEALLPPEIAVQVIAPEAPVDPRDHASPPAEAVHDPMPVST